MKFITKLAVTAVLAAGFTAAPAMAGPMDLIKKKAESEAKKEVRKEMKKQAVDKVVSATGMKETTVTTAVDGGEKALEMTGMIDKVSSSKSEGGMMDKAMGMAKGGMKIKGGQSDDAATMSTDGDSKMESLKKKMMGYPGGDKVIQKGSPAIVAEPAQVMTPTNCPSGTTGQPDGTCMITGDYGS